MNIILSFCLLYYIEIGLAKLPIERDFNNSTQNLTILTVAVEEWVPHVKVNEDADGLIRISGPMANLLETLAQSLNFRYNLIRPADGAWGIPMQNGSWNGMIGMVSRNEADLALGPFGLTFSRSRVVEFSTPILIDYYRILVRRPLAEPNPFGFSLPFTWIVWLILLMALFGTSVVLNLGYRSDDTQRRHTNNVSNQSNILLLYGMLLDQPGLSWKKSVSRASPILILTWLVIARVLGSSYKSGLTSLMAVRIVNPKYNFLRDLIEDPNVHLVFEKATALVEHMSTTKNGIYKDLADTQKDKRTHFLSSAMLYEAAYNQVRSGQFALLVEDTTCRKVMSDDFTAYGKCDFHLGEEKYWPLIFSIIMRKGHPLVLEINERIGQMIAHDLYFHWLTKELPNATACLSVTNRITVEEPIGIAWIWGLFLVFITGLLMSVATFLYERSHGNI